MESDQSLATFAHLGLARWPFSLVPLAGDVKWFGRETVKAQVDRLLWRLSRVPNTSLHLIWADVGSGKTHTLRYMEQRIAATEGMRSAFAIMPRGARGFQDVYSAIVGGIDFTDVAGILARLGFDNPEAQIITAKNPDVLEAARAFWMGLPQDRALVREWFKGSKSIPIRDLRRLGISQPVRTFESAAATLEAVGKVTLSKAGRLVIMLDEAQRIGTVRGAITAEICAGLQSWYNDVPRGLSIIMAFSFGDEAHLAGHLTPELLSREDSNRVSMPALSRSEATEFIAAMVDDARIPGSQIVPIGPSTIFAALNDLIAMGVTMTPRNLIKGFDAVLSEIDFTGETLADEDRGRVLAGISFDVGDDE